MSLQPKPSTTTATEYPPFDERLVSLLWAEADRSGEIAAMHKELFDPAWDEEAWRKILIDPCTNALVAKVRLRHLGAPVPAGFAVSRIVADEAEILSIGVTAPFQRRSIGDMLVRGLKRAAKSAGAQRLFLEVADDNTAARKLYSATGFLQVGERRNYYKRRDGTSADALTLAVDLTKSP
ncbi:MAG: GNAT family N-acetyltransferase [Filomicrobium sp.]